MAGKVGFFVEAIGSGLDGVGEKIVVISDGDGEAELDVGEWASMQTWNCGMMVRSGRVVGEIG